MKLEDFKSGVYKKQFQYKSFSPTPVNHAWRWDDPRINTLLEQATKSLGELNAFAHIVPDIDLFIEMHVAKEANTSSRIEGTQTKIDDAIIDEEQVLPEKRNDWQEVQNYIRAMNHSLAELQSLPLSNRLLKAAHKILMSDVRGEKKSPGEFRRSQNWIGGSSLADAVFIPPHESEVKELMGDLERFWHNEEIDVPQLIRIAISHYQFETIHPFLDGNGRIGRLLITLFLVSAGFLHKPSLYLSDYLEKHKGAYFDALTTVRVSNNLIHWVKFFLVAVHETAEKGKRTFQKIFALRKSVEQRIMTLGRRAHSGHKLVELLYRKPIVSGEVVARTLDLTPLAANRLIDAFVALDILKETTGFRRNRRFVFKEYLELFSDDMD